MSTWPSTQPLAPWTAMIGPICKDYSYYSMNLVALWTEMLKNKILCWFNQTQLLTKVTRLHLYNSHCICCKTHLIQIWKKNNIQFTSTIWFVFPLFQQSPLFFPPSPLISIYFSQITDVHCLNSGKTNQDGLSEFYGIPLQIDWIFINISLEISHISPEWAIAFIKWLQYGSMEVTHTLKFQFFY